MSEYSPLREPLDVPLSDEELRRWKDGLLSPDGDIWPLIEAAIRAGAGEYVYHPSDPRSRIARFCGRGVPEDWEGVESLLPILDGKCFEIVFSIDENIPVDVRKLVFLAFSPGEKQTLTRYEMEINRQLPKVLETPKLESAKTLLPSRRAPTLADTMAFSGTVGALWEENAPRSM